MKKSSLLLLSAMLVGSTLAEETVTGRDLFTPETHPTTWVCVSLADPLQVPPSNYNMYGLRWSIFYGNNFTMKGLDIGLVGRVSRFESSANEASEVGLALTGASWVAGDAVGAQIAAVLNADLGNMTGFQLSGLVNVNHGVFTGFQVAPINHDGVFDGVQFGVLNWEKGICSGLQLGGGNIALSEFHGCSIGLVNYTERVSGLQLGVVNVAGETGTGVQIGLFNGAPMFSGLQIGLLNVIGNAVVPTLPILNFNF